MRWWSSWPWPGSLVSGAGVQVPSAAASERTPYSPAGYWLATADGGTLPFPSGSNTPGIANLNAPVVGIAAGLNGFRAYGWWTGYWLVAADGGVFSEGNAGFYGSAGGTDLNAPMVGMAVSPSGDGYWLVGADGGVFSYGNRCSLALPEECT